MATTRERDIFAEQVLRPIGQMATPPSYEITGFLSMKGNLYDRKLMLIGRAVNGWIGQILPAKLADPSEAKNFADIVFNSVEGGGNCPMSWVTKHWGNPDKKYSTTRSAFWRVIRGVVDRLGIADVDRSTWPSHLVWSNLYKVAPTDGGNPTNKLCEVQLEGCLALLEHELETYRPERLLLMTGRNWAKTFLKRFVPDFTPVKPGYVQAVGRLSHPSGVNSRVVVAVHPQGKQEARWVNEVIEQFNK